MDVVVHEEKIVVHITIQGKRSPPRSFKAWFVFNVTCSTIQIVGPNLRGHPRCKNLWYFSLSPTHCFNQFCCAGSVRAILITCYVTRALHRVLHRGWANLQHIMLWAPCQHLTSWSETLQKHWYAVFLLCRLLLLHQGLLWSCSGYYQYLPTFSLVLWKIKAIWNHSSYKFLLKFLLKRCSKVQRDFIPCHSTCTKCKY